MNQVRVGALGAARVTPMALIRPARSMSDVIVSAIASRDPARAGRFARRYGIARVHRGYAELLADDQLDAVYVALPNSLHAEWTRRALLAGKHVLCEKPFASNAGEAAEVAEAAAGGGRVVMEALHYRYHPLAERMRQIVHSGELGELRHVEATLRFPLLRPGDIRYSYRLAGGATMDLGCYAIHLIRLLSGSEPTVRAASCRLAGPQVDRFMRAEFVLPNGQTARMACSLLSAKLL